MRSLKLGIAAAAVMCALSATAQAGDCIKVAAIGDGLNHDLAVIMSTHGPRKYHRQQGPHGQRSGSYEVRARHVRRGMHVVAECLQISGYRNYCRLKHHRMANPCDGVLLSGSRATSE